jgi:hypothetical protein
VPATSESCCYCSEGVGSHKFIHCQTSPASAGRTSVLASAIAPNLWCHLRTHEAQLLDLWQAVLPRGMNSVLFIVVHGLCMYAIT